jgi:hypothetical protein
MAKPVALIDDGKISGLAGTNNGDVLTWNSSTQVWESQAGGGGGGGSDWHLTGNAGTTPGTNYVGTSDAQQLQIRTNNLEAIRVDTAQQVGVNASGVTLTHAFEVHGSTHLNPTGGADTDIGNLANGGDVTIYAHQSNKTVDIQASGVNLQTAGAGTTTIGNTTSGGAVAIRTALAETATVTPGALTATLGTQTTGGTAGGAISMTAGAGATTGAGGAFNVTAGTGGATGAGGAVAVLGGTGGATSGTGGAVSITAGNAGATSGDGGALTIQSGEGANSGAGGIGGTVSILGAAGNNATTGEATGNITIRAGRNTTNTVVSGTVTIQGGCDLTASTNCTPGYVRILGGDNSVAANARVSGNVVIRGGNNTATTTVGSNGGAVSITGGSGRNGGNVSVTAGARGSTGTAGRVTISGASSNGSNTNSVRIEGGDSSGNIQIGSGVGAATDYIEIGDDATKSGGNYSSYTPVIFGGMVAFASTVQEVAAASDFDPRTSYLVLTSLASVTVSGNFTGTTTYPTGAFLIIRNQNTSAFTITIPATGSIRTLTNGAKALAVGGSITVQHGGGGIWYECATVLNAS